MLPPAAPRREHAVSRATVGSGASQFITEIAYVRRALEKIPVTATASLLAANLGYSN